jgi:hypothetical protein
MILMNRGVSVERIKNTDDWYVYHTQRTGMWTWTPLTKIAGPTDKKTALQIGKEAARLAPEPWDGPYDPRTDTVPAVITRRDLDSLKNPLSMGGATERNVLIGVAAVGLAALAYELFKAPAPNAAGTMTSTGAGTSTSTGSSTPSGPSSNSAQPYLITVPMSGSATDPAMPVPSGATIEVNAPAGGTGGFTAGLVSSPTSVSTDASGNAVTDYTVIAASGTSGSYAWTSADGSVLYSIPINVT